MKLVRSFASKGKYRLSNFLVAPRHLLRHEQHHSQVTCFHAVEQTAELGKQACAVQVGLGFALPIQQVEPLLDKSGQVLQVAEQETVAV